MKKSLLGFLIGLSLALLLTVFANENPFHIASILFKSAFGSSYDLGLTLYYTTGLIFTGLSVSLAFSAGLFNIGAEGQLLMGSIAAALCGVLFPNIPPPLSFVFAMAISALASSLWALIPVLLKVYRGSHEVIVTMMMNFIASGLTGWIALQGIPNTESQNPETAKVSVNYLFHEIDFIKKSLGDSPASLALIFALLAAFVVWFIMKYTRWGYEVQVSGLNPSAAERAGISVHKMQIQSFCLAGALASGVALTEVLGNSGQFRIGFSPDFGFIGIAVALMARNHPLGILLSAFLMGALHKGASDLDFETTTITRDFSKIIQGVIILFVAVQTYRIFKKRRGSHAH